MGGCTTNLSAAFVLTLRMTCAALVLRTSRTPSAAQAGAGGRSAAKEMTAAGVMRRAGEGEGEGEEARMGEAEGRTGARSGARRGLLWLC